MTRTVVAVSRWSKLHALVDRLASMACRHEAGIVCSHRHWNYDHRLAGYHDGFAAATRQAQEEADPFYPWPKFDDVGPGSEEREP